MKKHIKILTTLGLTMPLALTTSAQVDRSYSESRSILDDGVQLKTYNSNNNLVLERIADFTIEKPTKYDLGHSDVHNDNQPHSDHHTDSGSHTDSHSDIYGQHTDNHLDTGDSN